jgi:pimeloyl-ACP methyl ester carboxylesterase
VGALLALASLSVLVIWYRPLWVFDRVTQAKLALAGMRHEEVTLDGYHIHYFVGGQGTPVLLVHGLGSRATDWADLIPPIVRSGHRVYAIDLLGYGESDRPKDADYSIPQESKIVEDFIAAKNLQQVDLAGWSMGGWIAMVVATDMPDRVSRLVLMDSAGLRFTPTFDIRLFTPSSMQQMSELVGLLTPYQHVMPGFLAKALLERSQRDAWVIRRSVNAMLTGQDLLDGKLGQLKMPVLIVWGKQDNLTPLSLAYQIHAGTTNSRLQIYDGCGHLAPGLCASRIAPGLVSFLNGAGPQRDAEMPSEASMGLVSQVVAFFHARSAGK